MYHHKHLNMYLNIVNVTLDIPKDCREEEWGREGGREEQPRSGGGEVEEWERG